MYKYPIIIGYTPCSLKTDMKEGDVFIVGRTLIECLFTTYKVEPDYMYEVIRLSGRLKYYNEYHFNGRKFKSIRYYDKTATENIYRIDGKRRVEIKYKDGKITEMQEYPCDEPIRMNDYVRYILTISSAVWQR